MTASFTSAQSNPIRSRIFVGVVVVLLMIGFLFRVGLLPLPIGSGTLVLAEPWTFGAALCLAVLAWLSGSATRPAALIGALICLCLGLEWLPHPARPLLHTAVPCLVLMMVLTIGSTHFRRAEKRSMRIAEHARGRRSSQVIANLGVAAIAYIFLPHAFAVAATVAALCESTADTLASEIGSVAGGKNLLLTNLRPVAKGSDGGISLVGSLAGILGALAVAALAVPTLAVPTLASGFRLAALSAAAGIAGMFFDSLLGATLERRGWIGNDTVNFSSTAFAALLASLLCLFHRG